MTLVRRGILSALAALPFVPRPPAAAPSASAVVPAEPMSMTLGFAAPDLNELQTELHRKLSPGLRIPPLFPGERIMFAADDLARNRFELAPFGWDTLENVR